MTCKCGAAASFDSVDCIDGYDAGTPPRTVIDNGTACCDCEQFSCRNCIAKAESADEGFDDSLCVECNDRYVASLSAIVSSIVEHSTADAA